MLEILGAGNVVVLIGPLLAQMRRMVAWIVQFYVECSISSNGGSEHYSHLLACVV